MRCVIDSKNTIKVRKRGRISDTWTYDRVTGDIQYTEIYGDNCSKGKTKDINLI